jgi:hypothetical protein
MTSNANTAREEHLLQKGDTLMNSYELIIKREKKKQEAALRVFFFFCGVTPSPIEMYEV